MEVLNNIDVEKIVHYLKPFYDCLEKSYIWDTPNVEQINRLYTSNIISFSQFMSLCNQENMYLRNVLLKQVISNNLRSIESELKISEIYEWIVKDWGGLRNTQDISKRVNNAISDISTTQKCEFKAISSISKVLSFIDLEKFIIYDTRVAYSMNWILLKTKASNIYFPMPEGRNSKVNAIDISTLIRLTQIHTYKQNYGINKMISKCDDIIFIKEREAYLTMCSLIQMINRKLWNDDKKDYPFYTEMLLFSLADTKIFKDILNTCKIVL